MTKRRDYQLSATPCCGTKPLIYMRPTPHQFCHRCCREYTVDTEQQIENWAWKNVGGQWVATYPESEAAKMPGRIAA